MNRATREQALASFIDGCRHVADVQTVISPSELPLWQYSKIRVWNHLEEQRLGVSISQTIPASNLEIHIRVLADSQSPSSTMAKWLLTAEEIVATRIPWLQELYLVSAFLTGAQGNLTFEVDLEKGAEPKVRGVWEEMSLRLPFPILLIRWGHYSYSINETIVVCGYNYPLEYPTSSFCADNAERGALSFFRSVEDEVGRMDEQAVYSNNYNWGLVYPCGVSSVSARLAVVKEQRNEWDLYFYGWMERVQEPCFPLTNDVLGISALLNAWMRFVVEM